MEKIKSKLSFFKKLSLVQQLIVVLCFVGLLLVAVLMPIVDYNVTSIVDKQMYERLTISQYSIIYNNIMPYKQEKEVYHIIYETSNNSFVQSNIGSVQVVYDLYSYLFKDDLAKIVNTDQEVLKNKGEYDERTYYYMITKINNTSKYLISLVDSEYSVSLIASLRNQIIYIQYGFFIIFALVMILWVLTLINPLKKIKNYIDNIKDRKDSDLIMNREDEIGIVSKALVEMKEDLDKQESIKEEMIHNISHDLKTPIATIKSYGESIKDGIYPYDTLEKSVDVIIENADRLEQKVHSLLFMNRVEYLISQDCEGIGSNMEEIVETVVQNTRFIRSDIQILTNLEEVYFDGLAEPWRVVVENIIENALRYAKTTIDIHLSEEEGLTISNDGPCMDEDRLKVLFKPYEMGKGGKFGLGLSIVAKVVSANGYEVVGENMAEGVIFRIYKPKNPVKKGR